MCRTASFAWLFLVVDSAGLCVRGSHVRKWDRVRPPELRLAIGRSPLPA